MQEKTLTGWKILPLTDEDLDEVLLIEGVSYTRPWSANIFKRELDNKVSYSFAAKASVEGREALVAYTVFWIVGGEAHLLNLAVSEKMRGMGIAARLLSFALRYMAESSVEDVFLEVRRTNEAAIRLYEKFGFRTFYERKKYYGDEDALVMGLSLD